MLVADGGARVGHHPIEWQRAVGRRARHRPEHHDVGGQHDQQAPDHGPLAQAGGLPAQLEEPAAPRAESLHGPAREPEQPELLGGGGSTARR